ncbi:hypothetical protein ACLB1Q_04190 [Escherichia coli]
MDALQVDEWYSRVRRAAPWKDLPRRVFDATLDMLSGRYPSLFFAFRPKLVWNRQTGHRLPTWRSAVGGYQRWHHSGSWHV